MGFKDHDYRLANSLSAIVSVIVGIIMILASVQSIMVFPNLKQLWPVLLLSVSVMVAGIVFLITEIRRRPKKEHGSPLDTEA